MRILKPCPTRIKQSFIRTNNHYSVTSEPKN
jgi:hypothetical protein